MGWSIASVRYSKACVAVSDEDRLAIFFWYGKSSVVSKTTPDDVFGM